METGNEKENETNLPLSELKQKRFLSLLGKLHDKLDEPQKNIISKIYAASTEWKMEACEESYKSGYADGYKDAVNELRSDEESD